MIQIHNLAPEQVELLNKIWSMDDPEEFERFCRSLPANKRNMVSSLCIMIEAEYLEVDIQCASSYPVAENWLTSIGVKLK